MTLTNNERNYYFHSFRPLFQILEQRIHSTTQSLQVTPNSTIHSLPPLTHPPLVDLWGAGLTETYPAEVGGYIGLGATIDGNLTAPSEDMGTEHSPLLEAQEEDEIKVRSSHHAGLS